jgi:hypothetical protein
MPTLKGVTVTLHSQYEAAPIPEYVLSQRQLNQVSSGRDGDQWEMVVVLPHLPSSQFWISYSCSPGSDDETRFYYFKLNFRDNCVLSWGVGAEDSWSGKTVFAPFDAGTDFDGSRWVEKRGFFFPNACGLEDGVAAAFEIQVFRSKARRREGVKYERYVANGSEEDGMV